LCEGKEAFLGEPVVAAPDAPVAGAYQLPVSGAPERCALGVIASDDRDKDHPVEQWIDFRIRN